MHSIYLQLKWKVEGASHGAMEEGKMLRIFRMMLSKCLMFWGPCKPHSAVLGVR